MYLNFKIKRVLLSFLTMLPISSIAMVSESKLISLSAETESETRVEVNLVLPQGLNEISKEEAKNYFLRQNGLADSEETEVNFDQIIATLKAKNLIKEVNDCDNCSNPTSA